MVGFARSDSEETTDMQYVYVLKSLKDGNLYVGCTGDVQKRVLQHQAGKVRSTKGRLPVELVYKEEHADKYEAFRKERFYKTPSGKKELKQNCQIV